MPTAVVVEDVVWVNGLEASCSNSVDPDQTAPIGAVGSGSTLFASVLELVNNVSKYFLQTSFFKLIFVSALRVKYKTEAIKMILLVVNESCYFLSINHSCHILLDLLRWTIC